MLRVGRALRTGALATALLLGAALAPRVALAADERTQTLPGATLTALTIDLNGDGASEVLRLVDRVQPGLNLEAWSAREATWLSIASTEVALHPGPDGSLDPSSEIAALLLWRQDGRDHAVLATASMLLVPNIPGTVCCVDLAEVVLAGGGLRLVPMPTQDLRAEYLAAVDMDGDGTDELVTQATAYHDMNDSGTTRVEVHRWDGDGFDRIYSDEREGQGFGLTPGEADGEPGAELYITPSAGGSVERLVLGDGAISSETGSADIGQPFDAAVIGAANGRLLMQVPEGLRAFEWPRDGRPTEVGRFSSLSYPTVDVVGSGADAIFVVYEGFDYLGRNDPRLTVLDMSFEQLGVVPVSERVAPLWDAAQALLSTGFGGERYLFPFVGRLPDAGPGDGWAYLVNGMRIDAGGPDGYTVADASPFIGVAPIGRAGPDDEWLVIGHTVYGPFGPFAPNPSAVYLFPGGPPVGSPALTLAPADDILAPSDEPVASIRVDGAFSVEVDGETRLAASYDGFEVVIDAPAGTVVTHDGRTVPTELELGEDPVAVKMRAPNGPEDRNRDFRRTFFISASDGRAQVVTLEGTFIGEPPEVSANAATDVFALHSRIYGRASDGVAVTVNGAPAALNANGAYSVQVDAPIWPRDVVVVARDVLGNEATERLQVVGFVDYRGLPWAAIIGLATVAAGAFLFVRTPRRGERPVAALADGVLEEVDGDLRSSIR